MLLYLQHSLSLGQISYELFCLLVVYELAILLRKKQILKARIDLKVSKYLNGEINKGDSRYNNFYKNYLRDLNRYDFIKWKLERIKRNQKGKRVHSIQFYFQKKANQVKELNGNIPEKQPIDSYPELELAEKNYPVKINLPSRCDSCIKAKESFFNCKACVNKEFVLQELPLVFINKKNFNDDEIVYLTNKIKRRKF